MYVYITPYRESHIYCTELNTLKGILTLKPSNSFRRRQVTTTQGKPRLTVVTYCAKCEVAALAEILYHVPFMKY